MTVAAIFLKLLNMSIAAGWLILAVLVLRLLLKKAPKWVSCLLWGIVAVRLVCPFSLESGWSLVPSAETVVSNVEQNDVVRDKVVHNAQNGAVQDGAVKNNVSHDDGVQNAPGGVVQNVQSGLQDSDSVSVPVIHSGVTVIDRTVNSVLSESFAADSADPNAGSNLWHNWTQIGAVIWLFVAGCILLYALISFLRLKRRVKASVRLHDNVYVCDEVPSPFILGIIKPLVYLPSGMDGETEKYVIAHENTHLRRHDHWWKPFGYVLLAVYWFHPLSWIAYILFCRDIEMACDERAVQTMEREDKAAYAQALLDCSFPRRMVVACPLAFGEIGVKERVKAVLNYKRPAFWIIIVAIIACVAMAVCFLTDPKETDGSMDELVKKGADVVSAIDVESNSKETPETGYENSVPEINNSGSFVVGASVEDKQDFDRRNSEVPKALDAYQAVFEGQSDLFWESSEHESIKNLNQLVDFMVPRRTGRIAIIDLDDDNLPEVILSFLIRRETATAYDEDTFFILKYNKERVYAYPYSIDGLGAWLAEDGTFLWSNSESYDNLLEHGIAVPLFQEGDTAKKDLIYADMHEKNRSEYKYYINDQLVTKQEYDEAVSYQSDKPLAVWYDLSEKNIAENFIMARKNRGEYSAETEESENTANTETGIEEFVPDPPVTTAKSDRFVTGAPVVDKQIFDWSDNRVMEALDAYQSVLTGQSGFCLFGWDSSPDNMKSISQLKNSMSASKVGSFAVIDLDNDGLPEIALSALRKYFSSYVADEFVIFKYHKGHVYAYRLGIRAFNVLRMDGTFTWASSGMEGGTSTLLFQGNTTGDDVKTYFETHEEIYRINGQSVTREEEQKASEYQDSKPYATWYEFTEKSIEQFFSSAGL